MTKPTIISPTPPAKTPGQRINYIVGQLIAISARMGDDGVELGGIAIALGMIGSDIDGEIERLCAENRQLDRSLDQVMGERDQAQEAADKLAYAIAPLEAIGEHGGDNLPWDNAFEELHRQRAARDAEVRAAALSEAEAAVRAHVGSLLASAVFSNGVEFAADLVLVLKTAPR